MVIFNSYVSHNQRVVTGCPFEVLNHLAPEIICERLHWQTRRKLRRSREFHRRFLREVWPWIRGKWILMEPKDWEPKKDMSVPSLFTQLHKLCLLYHQACWVYLSTEALSDFCILETPSWPLKTGVIPNQAFTGLPNRRCLQTHTQIEFVYLDSLRLCNPDDKMIQLTESWHDGTMLVTHLSKRLKRHQILATFASSIPHRPWSWPLPGFGLREPWSHQWGPHWWTKKGISWNLFIHLFSSPLGTIQECQRSVEDVLKFLKAMKLLISRVSTTALVCGSWTLPLVKLWDRKQLPVPSREYVPNLTATMLALQAASFVWPRNFVLDLWGGGCNTTLWLSCEVSNFEASFGLVAPAKLQSIKDIAAEQWRRGLAAWIDFWTCFLKKRNSRERAEFKRHRTTDLQFRSTIETKRELLLIENCLRHLKLSAWGTFSIRSNSCFVGLLACSTPNSALLHVVGKVSCDGSDIFASTGSRKTRVSWHWRRGRGRVSPCEGCWCPRRAAEVFRCLRGFEGTAGRFWSRKAAAAACLDLVKVPWLRQLTPLDARNGRRREVISLLTGQVWRGLCRFCNLFQMFFAQSVPRQEKI